MKLAIMVLGLGFFAEVNATQLYRCQFTIERVGKEPHQLTGHILASDKEDITYLTLQPASSTDINIDARVLITGGRFGGYNPMTLHPRGETVYTVASGELHDNGNQIEFIDASGTQYSLSCLKE